MDASAVPQFREWDAVRVEEDEVGDQEGVCVGEPRHGPRRGDLPRDGAQPVAGSEDLRAGVELCAVDALEAAAGEVLRRVSVEQPAELVLAGLGREVAGEGVADEEGGVLAEEAMTRRLGLLLSFLMLAR